MKNTINTLYQELLERQEKDFNTLLNYYISLIKERNLKDSTVELSNINEFFKDQEHKSILGLWIYIRTNNTRTSLKSIEEDIKNKVNRMNSDYIVYLKKTKFYSYLKEFIIKLLIDNRYGLTLDDMINKIDIKGLSKNFFEKIMLELIEEGKVETVAGKQPRTYYIKSKN